MAVKKAAKKGAIKKAAKKGAVKKAAKKGAAKKRAAAVEANLGASQSLRKFLYGAGWD